MLVMESKDLLFNELSKFLQETLASEQLSARAESQRQRLIKRIHLTRDSSPSPPTTPYVDMTAGSTPSSKTELINGVYEEFENKDKPKQIVQDDVYSNLGHENIYFDDDIDSKIDDKSYVIPSSVYRNKPYLQSPPALPPSNHSSGRNSLIKDTADSCSYSSSSSKNDDTSEVQAPSPSALRCVAAKCGPLGRRGKYLMLDHVKQYWAAVVGQTLYLFGSEKDLKPAKQLDLTGYGARPVDITRNDFRFELISPGNKTYQFATDKQLEMNLWISAVNSATKSEDSHESRHQTSWSEEKQTSDDKYTRTPRPKNTQNATKANRSNQTTAGGPATTGDGKIWPPPPQETYDQPDPKLRPFQARGLYENMHDHSTANAQQNGNVRSSLPQSHSHQQMTYDLPEPSPRPVQDLSQPSPRLYSNEEEVYNDIDQPDSPKAVSSRKPSSQELRQLPPIPQETYDQPDGSARPVRQSHEEHLYQNFAQGEELYNEISQDPHSNSGTRRPKDVARKLPPIPSEQEVYDLPDSLARPVEPVQEEIYSQADGVISVERQDPIYKNDEPYPEAETEQECIYDFPEQIVLPPSNPTEKEKTCLRTNFTPPPPKMVTLAPKPSHVAAMAIKIQGPKQAGIKVNRKSQPVMTTFKIPFSNPAPWVAKSPCLKKTSQ